MRARTGKDDGFTLVEVISSMAVITVVLTGVTAFFIQSMKSVNLQGQRQTAVQILTDQMEELRAQPGAPDNTGTNGAYRWLVSNSSNDTKRNGLDYTTTWTCKPLPTKRQPSPGTTCIGPPTADESTWSDLLEAQVTVRFQSVDCPPAPTGCSYTLKTQISTVKNDPIFG